MTITDDDKPDTADEQNDRPRWLDYIPLDEIVPAARNPKGHAKQVIRQSIQKHGYVEPITMDERTGRLVAGHGRVEGLLADRTDGRDAPEGVTVAEDGTWLVPVNRGWHSKDDADAEEYLIGSNQTTILGGWDLPELATMLVELRELPDGLDGTGFTPLDVDAMLEDLNDDPSGGESGTVRSDGSLLSLADVTFGDPAHQVEHGHVYEITMDDATHYLVVGDVMVDWPIWKPLLAEGALFVPYPGPYAPLSERAHHTPLVMVQPDKFIAGHLLDKYEAVRGQGAIRRVDQDAA